MCLHTVCGVIRPVDKCVYRPCVGSSGRWTNVSTDRVWGRQAGGQVYTSWPACHMADLLREWFWWHRSLHCSPSEPSRSPGPDRSVCCCSQTDTQTDRQWKHTLDSIQTDRQWRHTLHSKHRQMHQSLQARFQTHTHTHSITVNNAPLYTVGHKNTSKILCHNFYNTWPMTDFDSNWYAWLSMIFFQDFPGP